MADRRPLPLRAPQRAVLGIVVVAAVGLAAIGQHVRYTELGYRAVRLEAHRRSLLAERKRWETARERLRDPRRLSDLAAEGAYVVPAADQIREIALPPRGRPARPPRASGEGWAARLLDLIAGG